MKARYLLLPLLLLTGCYSGQRVYRNAAPAPHPVLGAVYVSVGGGDVLLVQRPERAAPPVPLEPGVRFTVESRSGDFYRVRTTDGRDGYVAAATAFTLYHPGVHGSQAALSGYDRERAVCRQFATQADAQAAFERGETQLDGDADGVACESLSGEERARTASPTYTPSASPSGGGGPVHVRGHWRTNRDGSRTYVRPHTRSRPRGRR